MRTIDHLLRIKIFSRIFIWSGAAFAAGGPGNNIIAYALVCSCVWAVLQTVAELTIAFPVSGSYIDHADRWSIRLLRLVLVLLSGLVRSNHFISRKCLEAPNTAIGWTAIVGSDAAFFHTFVLFWRA